MITELAPNRNFTFINGDCKQNSFGCHRNSVPPKSIKTDFFLTLSLICFPQFPDYETMRAKNLQQLNFTIPSSFDLFWGKTRQIAHVSSPPFRIAQKTFFSCPAAEATCAIRVVAGVKTSYSAV